MAAAAAASGRIARESARPAGVVLWAVGLAGCAAAAAVFAITSGLDEPTPALDAALVASITLLYVGCGLIAWSRRPDSRFGPLLVVAGFAPLVSRLSGLESSVPRTVGEICRLLPVVLFLHVFLAYPSGRLERRAERRVVLAGYACVAAFGLGAAVLGPSGWDSVIGAVDQPAAADAVTAAGRAAIAGVGLAALILLVVRARSSGRAARQSLVTRVFALAVTALAIGLAARAFGAPGTEPFAKSVAFALLGFAPILLLAGFLRSRLARASLGELLVELRGKPAPADLRDAVARALRDPSVELVYWLPDFSSYSRLNGEPVTLPPSDDSRRTTLIEREGERVAALLHDPALDDEPELLGAVTAAAGIALENGRLHAELGARLEELRGSRARIVDAGQLERKRLERNLHDGAQQRLIALSLELGLLEEGLQADPKTRLRLERARREIAASLEELRDVARGLHPAVVSGHGLEIALEQLAARAPVPVQLTVTLGRRLPERVEVAAFYLVSESLANIGKHARATSATVDVAHMHEQLTVEVGDDGIGGADTERGSGLRGLADRVEALEGRLRVWSPDGGGTRLRAELPCAW
jgi:signal transduction histidine kinase